MLGVLLMRCLRLWTPCLPQFLCRCPATGLMCMLIGGRGRERSRFLWHHAVNKHLGDEVQVDC